MNNKDIIIHKINELGLKRVRVSEVLAQTTHYLVNIRGGFNGHGTWQEYLAQLGTIVGVFKEASILKLEYDNPDDIWYLSLVVYEL